MNVKRQKSSEKKLGDMKNNYVSFGMQPNQNNLDELMGNIENQKKSKVESKTSLKKRLTLKRKNSIDDNML